jgi:hypothetical protein
MFSWLTSWQLIHACAKQIFPTMWAHPGKGADGSVAKYAPAEEVADLARAKSSAFVAGPSRAHRGRSCCLHPYL